MKKGDDGRIVVVDLRGERAELLRAMLEPLGRVLIQGPQETARSRPALVVVDSADGKNSARLMARVRARLGAAPMLVLGGSGETVAGASRFRGPLLPSRLRAAARELLERDATPPVTGSAARTAMLARTLPLPAETVRLLDRAAFARVPILLTGEPGTGKELVARSHLGAEGASFHRFELPTDYDLAERIAGLPDGATVYVTGLDDCAAADEAMLVRAMDEAASRGLRFAVACNTAPAELRDDLRLRLLPVQVELRPLRAAPADIPGRMARVLGALSTLYDLEPPRSLHTIEETLQAYPWPLNHEELVAIATRVLLRATGKVPTADDLGIAPMPVAPQVQRTVRGDSMPLVSLERLVQELAHEIRNPLVSIKTFTHLLAERFEDAEFRGEYYRVVADDVDRIDGVLSELNEFCRLRPPQRTTVELAEVVRRCLDAQEFLLRKNGIEVAYDAASQEPRIDTDTELLTHALEAVIRQILGAMAAGGPLQVLVTGDPAAVRFGYATSSERTRTPDLSPPQRRQVVGLGNALAAHVLQALGGDLRIEDTRDGKTEVILSVG